jgi:hypothetical protein
MKKNLVAVVAATIVAGLLVSPADARPKNAPTGRGDTRYDPNAIAGRPHHRADSHLLV